MSVTRTDVGQYTGYVVAGARMAVTCLPQRGGHLCSLREVDADHEWLFVPPGGPRLGPVAADGDFMAHQEGVDDCFPTIGRSVVRGIRYPDHGSVWYQPWRILQAVERLVLSIELPGFGLSCERSIAPDGDGLRLDWRIRNHRDRPIPYIWAWHPLFAFHPGDRLELPGATHVERIIGGANVPGSWPQPAEGIQLEHGEIASRKGLKSFVPGCSLARFHSAGRSLTIRWDPLVLPWAGLWIRREPDIQQWALEPTNVAHDKLIDPLSIPPSAMLLAHSERSWTIRLSP